MGLVFDVAISEGASTGYDVDLGNRTVTEAASGDVDRFNSVEEIAFHDTTIAV